MAPFKEEDGSASIATDDYDNCEVLFTAEDDYYEESDHTRGTKGVGLCCDIGDEDDVLVAAEEDRIESNSTATTAGNDDWVMDSGCSYHMCPRRDWFVEYKPYKGGQVVMGNNKTCKVIGIGTVKLVLADGTIKKLTNVRHVPDLKRSLISLGTLEAAGFSFKGEDGVLKVMKGSRVVLKGTRKGNNLYVLMGSTLIGEAQVVSSSDSKTLIWHRRLGHMSEKGMKELDKQGLLCGDKISNLEFCEHCIFGKQTRVKFATGIHKTTEKLGYIHSDLWGPSQTPTHGGKRYFLTLADDFSRKVWIYLLKTKDEAFKTFVDWKKKVENQSGLKVKALRTDNGLEFCNEEFNNFCKEHGIYRNLTVRGTPQQIDLAERLNRTLLEKVRCMLSCANLPKSFWGEAQLSILLIGVPQLL